MSGTSRDPDPKVRENLEILVVSSKRTSWISLTVSIIAISVASMSVYFAYKNSEDDTKWKKEQIESLRDISEKIGNLKQVEKQTDVKKEQ